MRGEHAPRRPEAGTIGGRMLGLDASAVKEALVTGTDPAGNKVGNDLGRKAGQLQADRVAHRVPREDRIIMQRNHT